MKVCNKCNQRYDDSQVYCQECGEKLTAMDKAATAGGCLNSIRQQVGQWDQHQSFLMRWLPAILSVVGLLVAWELSAVFGMVFALCGTLYGWFSSNQLNKIISIVVGLVVIILAIITLC